MLAECRRANERRGAARGHGRRASKIEELCPSTHRIALRRRQALSDYMATIPRPVIFVSALIASSLLGDQALYVILPVAYPSLGLSPLSVGFLLSTNRWVEFIHKRPAAWLLGSKPIRQIFFIVLVVGSSCSLAYAATTNLFLLVPAGGVGLLLVDHSTRGPRDADRRVRGRPAAEGRLATSPASTRARLASAASLASAWVALVSTSSAFKPFSCSSAC